MGDAKGYSEDGCPEKDDEEIREGKGQRDQVSLDRTAEKCNEWNFNVRSLGWHPIVA